MALARQLQDSFNAIRDILEPAPISSVTNAGSVAYAPLPSAYQVEPVEGFPAYSPLDTTLSPEPFGTYADDSLLGQAPTVSLGLQYDSEPEPLAVASEPSTKDSIVGALKSIGENLFSTVKTTVESTVRTGLTGGVATSSGAASGAQVGAGAVRVDYIFLGVAALLVVLLLRKK